MKILAKTSKRPSKCPQEQLEETLVRKFTNFSITFRLLSKNLRPFAELFSADCQERSRYVGKKFEEIFSPFGHV